MAHIHKLIASATAACISLSCLGACSSPSLFDMAQELTGKVTVVPTHSSNIEGTWCLEAGTMTGGDSLTFNSVKDERNMLVVSGTTATLRINGTEHPLNICVNYQDDAVSTAIMTDDGNTTVINVSAYASEGENRDSIVLASGYNNQVFLVGIREDMGLPAAEVEISDEYWTLFNKGM